MLVRVCGKCGSIDAFVSDVVKIHKKKKFWQKKTFWQMGKSHPSARCLGCRADLRLDYFWAPESMVENRSVMLSNRHYGQEP